MSRAYGLGWPGLIAERLQPTRNGPTDAFVARYGPGGDRMYSTYLGGGGDELGFGLAVDGSGNA